MRSLCDSTLRDRRQFRLVSRRVSWYTMIEESQVPQRTAGLSAAAGRLRYETHGHNRLDHLPALNAKR